jgi:hypothetical protein
VFIGLIFGHVQGSGGGQFGFGGVQVKKVNAYVMYQHAHLYIWKLKESSLLSHYDFKKMVALHLINPEKYLLSGSRQKRKCDDGDDSCTFQSRNSDTKNSSKKSAIMNDKTLHPDQGELQIHLNTGYFSCPVCPKAKDPSCQLH